MYAMPRERLQENNVSLKSKAPIFWSYLNFYSPIDSQEVYFDKSLVLSTSQC